MQSVQSQQDISGRNSGVAACGGPQNTGGDKSHGDAAGHSSRRAYPDPNLRGACDGGHRAPGGGGNQSGTNADGRTSSEVAEGSAESDGMGVQPVKSELEDLDEIRSAIGFPPAALLNLPRKNRDNMTVQRRRCSRT